MRRLLAILVSALATGACAGPTENKPAANANNAVETKASMMSESEVIAKEKQAWDS